jgi:hypothetical protein
MVFEGYCARETQPRACFCGLTPSTYAGFVTRFAAQLSERSVHRAGGGVSHVGEYVRVDVEGEAYVGVSQKFLHELGVHPLSQ